ncbi:hypothetical protein ACQ1Y7_15065, partial [Enterococcus faecalis]|uniref:hypothetical protein n=1 Tax=Enterococcus faecalis TaxID=1351 RepID=UPI003D6C6DAF
LYERNNGALPTVVGATAPRENINSDSHQGMEFELRHSNKVGEATYNLRGMVTITRNKYLYAANKGPWANSYDRWKNDNLNNRYQ